MAKITIAGAGSFGCALAVAFEKCGHEIVIWTFSEKEKKEIEETRENKQRLPGVKISEKIKIISNPSELKASEFIFMAVPSLFLRKTARDLRPYIDKKTLWVNVSKGIEEKSFKGGYTILAEECPGSLITIMCGPSHAEELAREVLTCFVVASEDILVAERLRNTLRSDLIKICASDDPRGVEIGSTFKNIIALAAGILAGMRAGENTKAALLTKGLFEIMALGIAAGGKPETFMGLSGLGDLIATCGSEHSRNRQMGVLLGKGYKIKDALTQIGMVVEGYNNAKSAMQLAQGLKVNLPLINCVYEILYEGRAPQDVAQAIDTF